MLPLSLLLSLLANVLSDPWKISPPGMWLIIGIVLATIEFLLPQKINKKFKLIPIILGCSALLEALILWGGSSLYMFANSKSVATDTLKSYSLITCFYYW